MGALKRWKAWRTLRIIRAALHVEGADRDVPEALQGEQRDVLAPIRDVADMRDEPWSDCGSLGASPDWEVNARAASSADWDGDIDSAPQGERESARCSIRDSEGGGSAAMVSGVTGGWCPEVKSDASSESRSWDEGGAGLGAADAKFVEEGCGCVVGHPQPGTLCFAFRRQRVDVSPPPTQPRWGAEATQTRPGGRLRAQECTEQLEEPSCQVETWWFPISPTQPCEVPEQAGRLADDAEEDGCGGGCIERQ